MHNSCMTNVQVLLRELRSEMTQSEIARRTGIAQSKISRWESGRAPAGADDALRLAALVQERRITSQLVDGA